MQPWYARHALISLVAGLAGLGALIYFLHRKRPPEVHLPVISCNYPEMGRTLPRDFGEATWGFFTRFD